MSEGSWRMFSSTLFLLIICCNKPLASPFYAHECPHIHSAGYAEFGGVEMKSMDDVQAQFNTNVFGVIRCQKAVLPAMRAQRSGKIINISSIGGGTVAHSMFLGCPLCGRLKFQLQPIMCANKQGGWAGLWEE